MGAWYLIGLVVGFGVAFGVVASSIVPRFLVAFVLAGAAAVGFAFALGGWVEAIGGVVGAAAGAAGASPVVAGALRRGGTRGGLALFVFLGALVIAALALVPVVGYLEALGLPVLGRRLRSKTPERFAGLRTLARD
jgi:hypothetical protein